jgi:hypothetical protein
MANLSQLCAPLPPARFVSSTTGAPESEKKMLSLVLTIIARPRSHSMLVFFWPNSLKYHPLTALVLDFCKGVTFLETS